MEILDLFLQVFVNVTYSKIKSIIFPNLKNKGSLISLKVYILLLIVEMKLKRLDQSVCKAISIPKIL